jgi:asparagine synthase (glutamine-hydrolysing)
MLRLSRAAHEAVTVLITGDGGDDVFLGYPHHRFLQQAQRFAQYTPAAIAGLGLRAGCAPPARGPGRRARNFAGYVFGGVGAFLRARPEARRFVELGLLGPRLANRQPQSHELSAAAGTGRTILDDYLVYARQHQFVSEYLAKVDGATMFYGLEARSPFLDHELWEFAATLPYSVRLHQGRLKAVLRELARRKVSPRLAAGGKRGFEVPIGSWLRGKWRERTFDLLSDSRLSADGWLNGRGLLELSQKRQLPDLNLWYAVVLEAWLRREAEHTPAVLAA